MEFHEVALQISSFYNGSTDQIKLAFGAMMIQTRDIIATKGTVHSTIDAFGGIEFVCAQIMRLYNSTFSNSMSQFTPVLSLALTVQNRFKGRDDQHTVRSTHS